MEDTGLENDTGLKNDTILIEECHKYGIPVVKKNGQMYSQNTLLKKLKTAFLNQKNHKHHENQEEMRGGAIDKAIDDVEALEVDVPDEFPSGEEFPDFDKGKTSKNTKAPKNTKASKKTKASAYDKMKTPTVLENPLGPTLDFHVNYKEGTDGGQAILEDPLIQAYFKRTGVSNIEDFSEVPVGLAMAVYGNHAQLGDSGLSERLPNVLENPELKEYWDSKGIIKVTPQTMIPVKFLYLNSD